MILYYLMVGLVTVVAIAALPIAIPLIILGLIVSLIRELLFD